MIHKRPRSYFAMALLFCAGLLYPRQARSATLFGNFASLAPGTNIQLSAEGALDWAHWGLATTNSFDHKNGVVSQIGNHTMLGTNSPVQYAINLHGYSWTGGTPTVSAANTPTGVLVTGANDGFQFTLPADATVRRLKVYVGVYGAQGKFE